MSCINALPGCSETRVRQETPSGATDCVNLSYTTAFAFKAGSLEVYVDGRRLAKALDFTEDAGLQGFTIQIPALDPLYNRLNKPLGQREEIRVDYSKSNISNCITVL